MQVMNTTLFMRVNIPQVTFRHEPDLFGYIIMNSTLVEWMLGSTNQINIRSLEKLLCNLHMLHFCQGFKCKLWIS